MDMIKLLNQAMNYIETNLEGEIDFNKVARLACCSENHFRRMFSYLAGMSVGDYIRKRRLTAAAVLLQNEHEKIIDIALRFGYESPDAFSKAFQAMHGITPSQVKKNKVTLKYFQPMTFGLTIKGGISLNYRIVEKSAFNIIGKSGKIPLVYNGPNTGIADVWGKHKREDLLTLVGYSDMEPKGILNVYANFEDKTTEGTELDFYVGIASDKPMPERWISRFEVLKVEASEWVVFTSVGTYPDTVKEIWSKIYPEWFPSSGYEHSGGPEMMWFESYDFSKPDFKAEIWFPIKKI
ncbi:MAG: AraC family transcriptional regulator [Eubacteriales bacterium]